MPGLSWSQADREIRRDGVPPRSKFSGRDISSPTSQNYLTQISSAKCSPHTVAVLSGLFRHYHGQLISQSEQSNTGIGPIGECLESGTHQVSGVTNCLSSEYSTGWSTRPGSDNWTRQMRAAHTRPGQSLRPLRSYQISIIDKHSIPIQSYRASSGVTF